MKLVVFYCENDVAVCEVNYFGDVDKFDKFRSDLMKNPMFKDCDSELEED